MQSAHVAFDRVDQVRCCEMTKLARQARHGWHLTLVVQCANGGADVGPLEGGG